MFHPKINALPELQQNGCHLAQKKHDAIFGQPMENVHASLRSYLVPYILLIPSDMIPYHSP